MHQSVSTILNDEHSLGKRVQVATLIGAVCNQLHSGRIIIFCTEEKYALEWCYHLAVFAPSIKAERIAVSSLHTTSTIPYGIVYVVHMTDDLSQHHIDVVNALACDLLVLDEAQSFCSSENIHLLGQITVPRKIVVSTDNIMV